MSTENDKELDSFLRQLTKDIPLEEPQDQFTENVLNAIKEAGSKNSLAMHTPLFSRASWFLIVFLASTLLILAYDYGEKEPHLPGFFSLFSTYSTSELFGRLPVIGDSNILVISFLALVSAVAFQIVWLKRNWAHKQVMF